MHTSKSLINTICIAIGLCLFVGPAGTTSAGDIRLKDQTGCWLTWQQLAEQLPDSIEGYTVVGEDHPLINDSIELSEDDYPTQVWASRTYAPKDYPDTRISIQLGCGETRVRQILSLCETARVIGSEYLVPISIHGCEGYQWSQPGEHASEYNKICLTVAEGLSVTIVGKPSCDFEELTLIALELDFNALYSLADLAATPWEEVAQDSVFLDDYVEENWESCYIDWTALVPFLPTSIPGFKLISTDHTQTGGSKSTDSLSDFDTMVEREFVSNQDDSVHIRISISCGATWTHVMRQWFAAADRSEGGGVQRTAVSGYPAFGGVLSDKPVSPTSVLGVLIDDLIGVEIQGMKVGDTNDLKEIMTGIDLDGLQRLTIPARTPWERKEPR